MKYFFIIILFVSTGLKTFSQETAKQKLTEFNELIIQGRFTVDIEYSDEMEAVAVAHGEAVDLENLSYDYSDNALKIKYSGSLLDDVDLNLIIKVNKFTYLEARHGVEIRVAKNFDFNNNPMSLKSVSGGKISINLEAPTVTAEISKGGSIRISGKTKKLDATVKTGGTIGAANLNAEEVKARVSLGGEIICAPEKSLDAQVTSGGTINYKGKPEDFKEKTRLGGTIKAI